MAEIPAILTSLSAAIDIARGLSQADNAIERADFRLKLAEVVNGLADAKNAIADFREQVRQRDEEIKDLRAAFELKDELVRVNDAYYTKGPDGQGNGEAYCLHCWNESHKASPVIHKSGHPNFNVCPACKTEYHIGRARKIP